MTDWRDRLISRRRIAIDMDHVMADTGGYLVNWLGEQHGLRYDTPQSFGTLRRDLTGETRAALINHVSQGDMFRNLPIMDACVETIQDLNERFAVLIVTAAMEYPNGIQAKIEWLNEHFPFLDNEQFVFCGPKQLLLADHLIDDSPKHFDGLSARPLLYSAPHNLEFTDYDRVDDWVSVADYFRDH